MPDFNLLPSELAPKASIVRMANYIGKFSLVAFTFYVVGVIGLGVKLYYSNITISDLISQEEKVKTSIKALEETEQKLILVKDRISVSDQIEKHPFINDEIDSFISFYDKTSSAVVRDADINQFSLNLDLSVSDSDSLTDTIELLKENGASEVTMEFLRYQSGGPYSIRFRNKVLQNP